MRVTIPKPFKHPDERLNQHLREIGVCLQQLAEEAQARRGYWDVTGWNQYNLAANSTNVQMDREFDGFIADPREWIAKRPGEITGMSASLSGIITAGTVSARVFKANPEGTMVYTGASITLSIGARRGYVVFPTTIPYAAGDRFDVRSSTVGLAPTTLELLADFEVRSL